MQSNEKIARHVPATRQSLEQCGERLRDGKLVSFPTETVYGLGCHALDPVAVQKVFNAKERPLSDPLIVHVTDELDALSLWCASSDHIHSSVNQPAGRESRNSIESQALRVLVKTFFPGPLTIVARARQDVPQIIMANTGYVACRSPSHPVARALIATAGVPIAAPSANKFGHVSPTLASHVLDDLGLEDVWVVDPSLGNDVDTQVQDSVCKVGVESTVAKIEMNPDDRGSITILRHGAISSQSIRDSLDRAALSQYFDVADSVKFTSEKTHNVAPGQTVKHYSPNVPCFMVSSSRQGSQPRPDLSDEERTVLSKSVIIDCGRRLSQYQECALAYRDLSSDCEPEMAAANIFETLRWSETVSGAERVFVPDMQLDPNESEEHALTLAVKDKLTRAASAVVVESFETSA